ncbi:formin-J-like [Drosophila montana]|uniref:formin-J-like n=1 Tax=Drosophila montana TaxID=40370 RepID=UPI00313E0810
MPIVGQQYANGFRPYSSFRVPRGSCGYNNSNSNMNQQIGQPLSSNGANSRTTTTKTATAAKGNSQKNNTVSSSSCSSSSSLNQQPGLSNGFSRQQPWRSSYCSSNRQLQPQQQQRNVKPLTPKLIRRIENTCAAPNSSSRYGKPRAPAPPAAQVQSRKPSQLALQQSQQSANSPQKRGYQATNARCAKENCPTARHTQRSSKNYPAPLPPQQPQTQSQRKQPNDLITLKATPLAQRRQLPVTPKLSLRQRAAASATATSAAAGEGEGGASSTGSSDSHDSPKLKKAYSKKFPQGLPFEDEFYGRRNRSYSQSSSNYSFYSSVGAPATPQDEDDDEFQRKPATDEALYVDFSKVVHSHRQQRQYVPASSWIRATPDHDEMQALRSTQTSHNKAPLTPAQLRRKSAKYARSMHEYLYSDDSNTNTSTTKHRLSVVDEPEDGYYSYAAGTPEPQTPPTPRTDIYVAAASWAPKPLYADRVLLPANVDSNNNCRNHSNLRSSKQQQQQQQQQQQTRRRSEHLGSTTCEYK